MNAAATDPRVLRGMEALLKLREERLSAGQRAIGWKVGFGAPASMQAMSIDAPLVGFLTDSSLVASGSVIALSEWTKMAVEPEIAVHVGQDVDAGSDRETARAAVAAIGPAMELADVAFAADDIATVLAANIYHRNLILGRAETSRAGCDLDGLTGRIYRDGVETVATTEFQALTGDYVDIVRHVADLLHVFGLKLRAGEIIITGSIVPPILSTQSAEVRFFLDPIESLTVNLTDS